MEVIIIESEAFFKLLELAVERVGKKASNVKSKEDPGSEWLSLAEAMKVLPYRSRTKWQELRDSGQIIFSQFGRKILYSHKSLTEYIKKNKIES